MIIRTTSSSLTTTHMEITLKSSIATHIEFTSNSRLGSNLHVGGSQTTDGSSDNHHSH
jgi:hypothetical protein